MRTPIDTITPKIEEKVGEICDSTVLSLRVISASANYLLTTFAFTIGEKEPEAHLFSVTPQATNKEKMWMFRTSLYNLDEKTGEFKTEMFGYTSRGASRAMGFKPEELHRFIRLVYNGFFQMEEKEVVTHPKGQPELERVIPSALKHVKLRDYVPEYTKLFRYPDGDLQVTCKHDVYKFQQVGNKKVALYKLRGEAVRASFTPKPILFTFAEGVGPSCERFFFTVKDQTRRLPDTALDQCWALDFFLQNSDKGAKKPCGLHIIKCN